MNGRLSRTQWDELIAQLVNGQLTPAEASEAYGVSRGAISAQLKKRPYAHRAVRRLFRERMRGNPPSALPKLRRAVGKARECYPAAEALYHNAGGRQAGLTPMQQIHEGRSHWWVRGPEGEVLDPAGAQFRTPVPYERGRGRGFLTKKPSKRARQLAKRAGVKLNPTDHDMDLEYWEAKLPRSWEEWLAARLPGKYESPRRTTVPMGTVPMGSPRRITVPVGIQPLPLPAARPARKWKPSKQRLLAALEKYGFYLPRAGKELGMTSAAIGERMRQLGIELPENVPIPPEVFERAQKRRAEERLRSRSSVWKRADRRHRARPGIDLSPGDPRHDLRWNPPDFDLRELERKVRSGQEDGHRLHMARKRAGLFPLCE